jgi:hypothetical protein
MEQDLRIGDYSLRRFAMRLCLVTIASILAVQPASALQLGCTVASAGLREPGKKDPVTLPKEINQRFSVTLVGGRAIMETPELQPIFFDTCKTTERSVQCDAKYRSLTLTEAGADMWLSYVEDSPGERPYDRYMRVAKCADLDEIAPRRPK